MNNQSGSAVLCVIIFIACASIYAFSYYVINSNDEEDSYISDLPPIGVIAIEDEELKSANFIEPEDKVLFMKI